MAISRLIAAAVLLSFSAVVPLSAQTGAGGAVPAFVPVPPPRPLVESPQIAGFPVTGRVTCADTQHPARFAQVTLVPAASGTGDYDRGRVAVGRTDLDGRFTIPNVPPGDYFATADLTGYINNAPAVRNALNQGGDALNAVASVPRVQVSAGGAAAQLSLERGAILAGSVQWDDGSPAAGIQVSAQPAPATGAAPPSALSTGPGRATGFGNGGQTDDRGRFRLSGLAPGSYVLRATVQSPVPQVSGGGRFVPLTTLSVYAPDKLRRTDAAIFPLAAGEERADLTVVLGLGGMHTVSGQVSASAAPVRSGSVLLTDATDSSLNRRGSINADGSFSVPYVPAGTYTLRVTASSQPGNSGRGNGGSNDTDSATRFQPLQESVTVADSDLTGLSVTVTMATGQP